VEHAQYVERKGHTIYWLQDVLKNNDQLITRILNTGDRNIFLSFDIDSIKGSDCPGVSCPGTRGLSAEDALHICFVAGKMRSVGMLDLSEANPFIENSLTPRLAASLVIYFLYGYAQGKERMPPINKATK
jgi:formiminoglutamase